MKSWPVVSHLPARHRTAIGQIVTRWAYFEWRLKQVAYKLLDVTPKQGRIAVREPRVVDYITMLEDLMELRGIETRMSLRHFRRSLEHTENARDWISHGIWIQNPRTKEMRLQLTKGSWRADPTKQKGVSRKKVPQSIPANPKRLKNVSLVIDTLISFADEMERDIDRALAATRSKPTEPRD